MVVYPDTRRQSRGGAASLCQVLDHVFHPNWSSDRPPTNLSAITETTTKNCLEGTRSAKDLQDKVFRYFEHTVKELRRVKVSHYAHKVREDNGITSQQCIVDSDGAEILTLLILKGIY